MCELPTDFYMQMSPYLVRLDKQFLARDSIYAIARYMLSPVRLSVCHQSKTVEVRITQPSPQSSPMTLVS